jgi:hypothetical protein
LPTENANLADQAASLSPALQSVYYKLDDIATPAAVGRAGEQRGFVARAAPSERARVGKGTDYR